MNARERLIALGLRHAAEVREGCEIVGGPVEARREARQFRKYADQIETGALRVKGPGR